MIARSAPRGGDRDALWRETLAQGHVGLGVMRRMMRLLPGAPRCKICNNPFGGFGGHVCRAIGFKPSRKNPRICALCCEKLPVGGVEIETAVMFADVRGSTALAERIGPAAFADALNRFYQAATNALVRYDATIDKLIGDEVMAFFIPGFAGPGFKRAAVEGACALRRALGEGTPKGPWLPVGIGIDAGTAFVGNVGTDDYFDFTALGDPVNTAARIQAAAGPGELLVTEAVFAAVADRYPNAEARRLSVKGKEEAIAVRAIPVGASA